MKEHHVSLNRALALISATGRPMGAERKCRRLAAKIMAPESNRPRLLQQTDTASIFNLVDWLAHWRNIRPGTQTTSVYIAGCLGASAVGAYLGVPTFKPGTTADVPARIAQLNQEHYGSLAIRESVLVNEPGWNTWQAAKLSARPTHPASPVRVLPRHLTVEIPGWVTPQFFEALLNAALEPISLAHLAADSAWRSLMTRRGCNIDHILRYTRKTRGPVLATELSVIAPSGDAGLLVALVEWIVISLVVADDGER